MSCTHSRRMTYKRDSTQTRSVRIFDTTLRDGEQTPGVHIKPVAKAALAEYLEAFGVDVIEAGFPASSPGDFEAVRQIAEKTRHCEVAALARCVPADIDAVVEALSPARRPVVHIVLGVSDIHLEKKVGIDRADALRLIRGSIGRAKARMPEVQFSLEDATRAERPFLRQVVQTAVDSGATRINLADTVGCALPEEFGALIADVAGLVGPDVVVSAHCHDDMGLATANTLAAVQHGASQVEVTVNGIGERAGNTSIEEIAVALAMRGIAATRLKLERAVELSRLVAQITGVPVQPNRPVVGANAFAHSSGIHQDGILKDPKVYEFVPPALVGAPGHRFILTARSGRRAVAHEARRLGYDLDGRTLDEAYRLFLEAADAANGPVADAELRRILDTVNSPLAPAG